jgi:hypothetical protein
MNKLISRSLSKEGQVLASETSLRFPTTISPRARTCVPSEGQEERACSLLLGRTLAKAPNAFNSLGISSAQGLFYLDIGCWIFMIGYSVMYKKYRFFMKQLPEIYMVA